MKNRKISCEDTSDLFPNLGSNHMIKTYKFHIGFHSDSSCLLEAHFSSENCCCHCCSSKSSPCKQEEQQKPEPECCIFFKWWRHVWRGQNAFPQVTAPICPSRTASRASLPPVWHYTHTNWRVLVSHMQKTSRALPLRQGHTCSWEQVLTASWFLFNHPTLSRR